MQDTQYKKGLVIVHTGNGIYEKTPRCPRGRSVHCWCFCTGTRSRPCHHHSCSRSHDGPGSSSGHQEGRQEKDPQKGRQEENCPQGRLNQLCKACRTRHWALRPSLIQNRPLLRAFSLVLQTPCAPPELFATAAVRPWRSCRTSCCLFCQKAPPMTASRALPAFPLAALRGATDVPSRARRAVAVVGRSLASWA